MRVLVFPVAVAAIAALDGCAGISPTDPSVRLCHDDTLEVLATFPNGKTSRATMVIQDDPRHCRKAA